MVIEQLLFYVLLGAVAGFLAGLLGIGGGSIVVPGLITLFRSQQIASEKIAHLAIGTSLAVIIVTTVRALIAHHAHHIKFWSIFRRWLIPIALGVVSGVLIAHYLRSNVLIIIFSLFLFFVSIKTFLQKEITAKTNLPNNVIMRTWGFLVGAKSGLLGIGGGALSIPLLLYYSVPMRQAIMVAVATSLTVSTVGTIAVALTGLQQTGLPAYSLGYIYLPAWLGVSVGSLMAVPIGTHFAYKISTKILRKIFAVFLFCMAIHLVSMTV